MRDIFFLLLVLSIISVTGCITAFTLSALVNMNVPLKKVVRVAVGSVIVFAISTIVLVMTK